MEKETCSIKINSDPNLEDVRASYDGIANAGRDGIQVEFDETGRVIRVSSSNILRPGSSPTIYNRDKGFGGIWHPDNRYFASLSNQYKIGRDINDIVASAEQDWQEWKNTELEHPGVDFRTWRAAKVKDVASE